MQWIFGKKCSKLHCNTATFWELANTYLKASGSGIWYNSTNAKTRNLILSNKKAGKVLVFYNTKVNQTRMLTFRIRELGIVERYLVQDNLNFKCCWHWKIHSIFWGGSADPTYWITIFKSYKSLYKVKVHWNLIADFSKVQFLCHLCILHLDRTFSNAQFNIFFPFSHL